MNIHDSFPSKWLRSADLPEGQDAIYTIHSVDVETVGQDDDAETKPVVYFEETEKGLLLNKTNANTIAGLYGPETDNWIGGKIALYSTEVAFQGKMTLAIRVRLKKPALSANLTKDQAIAALEAAGLDKSALRELLIKHGRVDGNGNPVYNPSDTPLVRQLIADNQPAPESEPL